LNQSGHQHDQSDPFPPVLLDELVNQDARRSTRRPGP
jgi:hypothetical protein